MSSYITPEELGKRIQNLSKAIPQAIEKGLLKAAQNAEAEAKRYCTPGHTPYYKAPYSDDNDPRREPPHMRDVMYSRIEKSGGKLKAIVGNPKSYARPVHEGTSRMKARPFILDAIKAKAGETQAIMKNAVSDEIKKLVK